MDAEILTIGDELVTGHTINTNASFIAQRLTDIGLEVRYHTSVGDTPELIEEAIRLALKRCRVVICTGGLGPTEDDLTKRVVVKVFRRNLVFHEEILEEIRKRYAARGVEMPAINQNQALLPQGATFFPNKYGSAVGICIAEEGRVFVALPGVPMEMKQIVADELIPYLRQKSLSKPLSVRKLRTTGIIESALAEKIGKGFGADSGVRLAYLPSPGGVDLRVIASAESREQAASLADSAIRRLETICSQWVFGYDEDSLESVVGQLLIDNDKTLSVAESCTAGQLGMLITSVPGASRYFVGGIEAYANDVKTELLDVSAELLAEHGAVSEQCAAAMATGCRRRLHTDYAIAITGIAGPDGGSQEKPVGTVYVGVAAAHQVEVRHYRFGTSREFIRARASYAALELLRRVILDIL